ncbi:BMP family ABC transporter substrate-binding protein [Maritimibacter sp. 55A14]|uniref:BMP family ABC transporter substrate-binding protein n=1 Tax=Maritimibacter sp. 55A14 TaxID=2174844 RepID=UPI000D60CA50|nr:BMP family ABC transporter substrate-binding protein [Maritimibacter sp. 55A14]PWE32099.1 BMP family ABC transporter substrate-binding protein [Maritimibacter sp. 55A14]
MNHIRSILAAAALSLGLAAPAAAQDPLKVGFVYVGPIGDFGWSYQHDQGRLAVEEEFGDNVETVYQESVPEGADAERVLTQMALSGTDLIFTTSFGYMDPTLNVAKKFPNVKFEHATGYKRAPNVSTYSGRFYEGRTVLGHIAGHMTKTNKIGYIASFPIPEVVRGINAAYLAAKAVNPDVKFSVVWVSTWFDPAKEADAANALIDQGADVLMQHTDSPAAMTIAEDKGIYAFGQASDMERFGPNAQLTAIVDNWNPYYIERVHAVLEGTWESQDSWHGLAEGMTQMAPLSDAIPDDVKASTQEIIDKLASGEMHSFEGPINRQDGSAWLAEGERAEDGTLLGMDFYVEGIEGSLPK